MARSLRSPAVVMTAYVVVFAFGGPWLGSAQRNLPQIAIAVVLAVLAARGSGWARFLMLIYSVRGVLALFYSSTHWGPSEPIAASLLVLACALVEVALLVSWPMYDRTRPRRSAGQSSSSQFLPRPRLWVFISSVAAGLIMTLVPFSD